MSEQATIMLTSAVESYYSELKAFIIQKTGCPSTAEEILHETWLRVVSRKSQSEVQNPKAYIYRIANNLVMDWKRREKLVSRHVDQDIFPENTPANESPAESLLIYRERLKFLQQVVDELPPRCRQVFVMRKFESVSQKDIAHRLGISRNMVEKHLRKALHYCLKRLEEFE